MTEYILDYFKDGNIAFKVYAYPEFGVKTIKRPVTKKQKEIQKQAANEELRKSMAANKASSGGADDDNDGGFSSQHAEQGTVATTGKQGSACCTIF